MAPITTASNEETHAALLDTLDMHKTPKPFRNPNWKPTGRRNKNLKQILSEASRAQQSVLNTQQNSGASTPLPVPDTDGSTTPSLHPNPAQASQDLTRLVLEKNLNKNQAASGAGVLTPGGGIGAAGIASAEPSVTYTSIAAAPSFKPKRKYCDITGLPAKYTEPTTGLHYYNKELYPVVKGLSTSQVQEYKAARGAATVLKKESYEKSGDVDRSSTRGVQQAACDPTPIQDNSAQLADESEQTSSMSALCVAMAQLDLGTATPIPNATEHQIQPTREQRNLDQVNWHDPERNRHFHTDTSLGRGARRRARGMQNAGSDLSDTRQDHGEDEEEDDEGDDNDEDGDSDDDDDEDSDYED